MGFPHLRVSRHKIWQTLALRTPLSQEHQFCDFFGDSVKACNTLSRLPLLVDVRGLPDGPLFKFRTVPPVSNLSRYPTVVTCVRVCPRNSFLHLHCNSTTFSFVSLYLHLHWCSSESSNYDAILFYATCYHLAVYASTKHYVHLSFRIILPHRYKYEPSLAINV